MTPSTSASSQPPASVDPRSAATTGLFTPLATTRVFDGNVGTTPVPINLSGRGGIPGTATAVVLNAEVSQPSAAGYVRVTPAGQDAPVAVQEFGKGQTISNLVTVKLVGGALQIKLSAGVARILLDVAGYYGNGGGSTYSPLPTARVLDRTVGTSPVPVTLAGVGGVPADATAVMVNTEVFAPSAGGYVRVTPYTQDSTVAAQEFGKGQSISNLVAVKLTAGAVQVKVSLGTARILMDVAGYFSPHRGSVFTPLPTTRMFDGTVGTTPAAITVANHAGIPPSATAILVNAEVFQPSATGYLRVTPATQDAAVAVQEFGAGQAISNLVAVKLTGGAIQAKVSAGTARILMDVAGYYTLPVPASSTSRYVRNLSASDDLGNATTMRGEGCADAQANVASPGQHLMVLDIGAQTISRPLTSPGVLLTGTSTRITNSQLVTAVSGYLDGYASCRGAGDTPTVAVATNSDGDFNTYTATSKGADWATKVIAPLVSRASASGIVVAGANDIEAGFAATEPQAETWVTNYLANTTAPLVYIGSADGCPSDYAAVGRACTSATWTQAAYHRLAHGLGPSRIVALPQIYLSVQAAQWVNIDLTDVSTAGRINFLGPLTEQTACASNPSPPCSSLSPSQAWTALWQALSTNAWTQQDDLPITTDLRIDG